MSHSVTTLLTKKVVLQSKLLASGLRSTRRSQDDSEERERLIVVECPAASQSFHHPPSLSQLEARTLAALSLKDAHLLQHYAQIAQDLRPILPSACRWLDPVDVHLVAKFPAAAGGFADVYEATYDSHRVVLKSYRCYILSNGAQAARFHDEVHIWTILHQSGVDVVPLLGVYSTETHPFGLLYEHMDGLDLGQYLVSQPNVGRLRMLVRVARCLRSMHDLGIIHGRLQLANVLVDKDGTARIAGLGNASILSHSTTSTAEDGATKAGDIYSLGVMGCEIFTVGITTTRSMTSGSTPSRPNHHEVSDRVWRVIKNCCHTVASKRMAIEEVVALLEAEI